MLGRVRAVLSIPSSVFKFSSVLLLSLSAIAAIQKTVHVYKISKSILYTDISDRPSWNGQQAIDRNLHVQARTNLKGVQITRDRPCGWPPGASWRGLQGVHGAGDPREGSRAPKLEGGQGGSHSSGWQVQGGPRERPRTLGGRRPWWSRALYQRGQGDKEAN